MGRLRGLILAGAKSGSNAQHQQRDGAQRGQPRKMLRDRVCGMGAIGEQFEREVFVHRRVDAEIRATSFRELGRASTTCQSASRFHLR